MSIIDTLVSEARAVRENNIRQLPSIAARRVDAFVPDGAALRACATAITRENIARALYRGSLAE